MIEIRKDLENKGKSPFQEKIVLDNYFAGANRGEVLSQLKEAMQKGAILMVLTGEEGCGKTMMCRLLEHQVSPPCKTIFFSRTVDSFEEVVRVIAMHLGLDTAIAMDGRNVELALEQITDSLLANSFDLLIIFDEAENIYLATLERIRKMLDRINQSGTRMHILFSGRDAFLENCDQLSICDFQNTDELHFNLTPLTEADTADYLRSCAARLMDMDATKVFNDEVVDNIYALAKGNFRKTNILGEESLKSHGDDTSFMVLLENVKEDVNVEEETLYGKKYPNLIGKIVAYLPWIGVTVCCFLILLLWFNSGGDKGNVGQGIDQAEQVETVTVVRKTIPQLPERKESVTVEVAEKVQPLEEKATPLQLSEEPFAEDEAVVLRPQEKSSMQGIDQVPGVVDQIAVETGEKNVGGGVDEVAKKIVIEIKEVQAPQEAMPGESERLALLRPTQELKNKPGLSTESPREIIKAQPQAKVHKVIVATKSHYAVDRLYNQRVLAGLSWEKGEREDMYTVQLMALASTSAEKNFKKLLAEDRYRQEAGNFYIFKKATATESIFLFYGEYPSIERARLAKDSLPEFLRDHKPYALSIKGAIAKVRK